MVIFGWRFDVSKVKRTGGTFNVTHVTPAVIDSLWFINLIGTARHIVVVTDRTYNPTSDLNIALKRAQMTGKLTVGLKLEIKTTEEYYETP